MSLARSLFTVASVLPGVLVRRLIRGPKRPTWSFSQEAFLAFLQKESSQLSSLPVAKMRAFRDQQAPRSPLLKQIKTQKVEPEWQSAQWFIPQAPHQAVVLFFHGGGYTFGSIRTHNDLLARLALSSGARVLGVEYRLAPEHPFPAAIQDALSAYKHLLDEGELPQKIILMGDSAGAGLSLAVALRLKEENLPQPAGIALISPWVDLACTAESFAYNASFDYISKEGLSSNAAHYLQGRDAHHPHASPLFGDLRGLPPVYIQAGGAEVLLQDALSLEEKLRQAQVAVRCEITPDMFHDWQLFGYIFAQSRRAVDKLAEFVIDLTHRC